MSPDLVLRILIIGFLGWRVLNAKPSEVLRYGLFFIGACVLLAL